MNENQKPLFLQHNMHFINKIFQDLFEGSPQFNEYYDKFKNSYENDLNVYDLHVPKAELKLNTKNITSKTIEHYSKDSTFVGLDLPIFLEAPENSKERKKVMIIALDPLRSKSNAGLNHIYIGAPFAVQTKEKRTDGYYWKIITDLINNDCDLYLTDLFKLWMKNNGKKYNFKEEYTIFTGILKKEMEEVKPDLVLTFGTEAGYAGCSLIDKTKLLTSLHPSRNANGSWKKLFVENKLDQKCTFANKSAFILNGLLKKVA